ncbi:MAG: hypothetical protein GY938_11365 [Ketobacter sp.]|nr:hypothetical protein [Ketobacter sp.]
MNVSRWACTVATYSAGGTEQSGGAKITHKLYVSAVTNGLGVILLTLVTG